MVQSDFTHTKAWSLGTKGPTGGLVEEEKVQDTFTKNTTYVHKKIQCEYQGTNGGIGRGVCVARRKAVLGEGQGREQMKGVRQE